MAVICLFVFCTPARSATLPHYKCCCDTSPQLGFYNCVNVNVSNGEACSPKQKVLFETDYSNLGSNYSSLQCTNQGNICCCFQPTETTPPKCTIKTERECTGGGGDISMFSVLPILQTGCDAYQVLESQPADAAKPQPVVETVATGTTGMFIPKNLVVNPFGTYNRDVGIFVLLAINIGKYLFSIIGALAIAAGVYGGFLVLLSEGNTEQLKKGWGAIFAALTGILITFSAYLLVSFVAQALGVTSPTILLK